MSDRPRFAVDAHLGKLARLLRMLGFDAVWRGDWDDSELARVARDEKRTLLTRDRALAASAGTAPLESEDPEAQLRALVGACGLAGRFRPFTVCLECNGPIAPAAKEAVLDRLPDETKKHYDEFFLCGACGRVYWKGPHYERMRALVESLEKR